MRQALVNRKVGRNNPPCLFEFSISRTLQLNSMTSHRQENADGSRVPGEQGRIVEVDSSSLQPQAGRWLIGAILMGIGGLLYTSVPWTAPIWLGCILIATVIADFWALFVGRRAKQRGLSRVTIYRVTSAEGKSYSVDNADLNPFIKRAPDMFLPILGGICLAAYPAWFYGERGDYFVKGMALGALAGGIFGAALVAKAMLLLRLKQVTLKSAGLPSRQLHASAAFIASSLLVLYVFGNFGRTAYEALKPPPLVKTRGDVLFSRVSPKGDIVVEHRENVHSTSAQDREIWLVERRNPANEFLLYSYKSAAKVNFSPAEEQVIVSEGRHGLAGPVFLYRRLHTAQSARIEFIRELGSHRGSQPLADRLRVFHASKTGEDNLPARSRVSVVGWTKDEAQVVFAIEKSADLGAEKSNQVWFCLWNIPSDFISSVLGQPQSYAEALAAVETQKRQRSLQVAAESFIKLKMNAEEMRDLDRILACYVEEVNYLDRGTIKREAIGEERLEYFGKWPQTADILHGNVEVSAMDSEDRWQAVWTVAFDDNNPTEGIRIVGEREHRCELRFDGQEFHITRESIKLLKEGKQTETKAKPPEPMPRLAVTQEETVKPPLPSPPHPALPIFPEGEWLTVKDNQDDQSTGKQVFHVTVRGKDFTYEMQSRRHLRDPVNNPWKNPALRGVKEYGYTDHYAGKIIQADGHQFAVRITNAKTLNRTLRDFPAEGDAEKMIGHEWIFINVNGNIADARNPGTFFLKKAP